MTYVKAGINSCSLSLCASHVTKKSEVICPEDFPMVENWLMVTKTVCVICIYFYLHKTSYHYSSIIWRVHL